MKKVDRERKQDILETMMEERGILLNYESHLERLLKAYASGENHREEITDNIVAEFRPLLRKENGPNYDGPLWAEIEEALRAAEEYGRCKALSGAVERSEPGTAHREGQERDALQGKPEGMKARFSADEVQRCLFCGTEYRPAVEGAHLCYSMSQTIFKRKDGTGYAVWSCELTGDELAALTSGTSPLLIRPGWLIYFVEGPQATELYRKRF